MNIYSSEHKLIYNMFDQLSKCMIQWKCLSVHVSPVFPKLCSPFAQKFFFVMDWETHTNSFCDLTWHHDIIQWRHMISRPQAIKISQKPGNHIFWPCDLDLWPTTLTYNPSLAKVKVYPNTKNQGHRSNDLAVRLLTHRQTERRKDGKTAIIWVAINCHRFQTGVLCLQKLVILLV